MDNLKKDRRSGASLRSSDSHGSILSGNRTDTSVNKEDTSMNAAKGNTTYYVVFEQKPFAKGLPGVRTFTGFRSKAHFDNWKKANPKHKVLAKGLSSEKCEALTAKTPPEAYLLSAITCSRDPRTGELDFAQFSHELEKAVFAISHMERKKLRDRRDKAAVELATAMME